jgi:hypothetical protein
MVRIPGYRLTGCFTYSDFTIKTFLQAMELLVVGIVVDGLLLSVICPAVEVRYHTFRSLEVWPMAYEAVMPMPDLDAH